MENYWVQIEFNFYKKEKKFNYSIRVEIKKFNDRIIIINDVENIHEINKA